MSHALAGIDSVSDAASADLVGAATPTSESGRRGFVGALYHGDFGLPRTYWIAGALVGGAWSLLCAGLAGLSKSDVTFARLSLMLLPVWMVYAVVVLTGIWRAASRYAGANMWAVLAKFAVVMGWLQLLRVFEDLLQ